MVGSWKRRREQRFRYSFRSQKVALATSTKGGITIAKLFHLSKVVSVVSKSMIEKNVLALRTYIHAPFVCGCG